VFSFPRRDEQTEEIINSDRKQQKYYVLSFSESIENQGCRKQAQILCKHVLPADAKIKEQHCREKTKKKDDTGKNHLYSSLSNSV
jgi:hypothetical protein